MQRSALTVRATCMGDEADRARLVPFMHGLQE